MDREGKGEDREWKVEDMVGKDRIGRGKNSVWWGRIGYGGEG